jgi:hypothetical protein
VAKGVVMKNLLVVVALTIASAHFATGTTAFSQEAQIVHYDDAGEHGKAKRPDFSKAVIAIDFLAADAGSAVTAKDLFMKLGARDFSQGENPCSIQRDVICVRIEVGPGMPVSTSGTSYGLGSRGGGSTSGSFSGKNYSVMIKVFLVQFNGGDRRTIMLGESSDLAPEGTGYSSSTSYNGGSAGGMNTGGTSSLASVRQNSANKALTSLLSKNGLARFISCGEYAKWYIGADKMVQQSFRQ